MDFDEWPEPHSVIESEIRRRRRILVSANFSAGSKAGAQAEVELASTTPERGDT